MIIFSDSAEFAAEVLPVELAEGCTPTPAALAKMRPLLSALLGDPPDLYAGSAALPAWTHLFLATDSARSQCDQLIALTRSGYDIPDRTACLARTGSGFRGFKGRTWTAAPGNIHLAVHFAPGRAIERFEVAFTILAALSVVEAIDGLPGLRYRPGIRWVNDIVLDDAKVGGVLAYTQTQGLTVNSAVLGIGVNVEATPAVESTPFVPAVTSLRDLTLEGESVSLPAVLGRLLDALARNYDLLLQSGYRPLLERYRQRSTVTGRNCTICTEESDMEPSVIAAGRLSAIGDGLELHLDGYEKPITRGRLLVDRPHAAIGSGRPAARQASGY
jgi:BirA family biotin operon repressor/biotin-[acetyl-CoA-carboxylase] ligase